MATQIVTSSGFTCDINENNLDDAELLEMVVNIDDGDVLQIPKVLEKLLGKENKKAIYDHVRLEDGRVPFSALNQEIAEIFAGLNTKKK